MVGWWLCCLCSFFSRVGEACRSDRGSPSFAGTVLQLRVPSEGGWEARAAPRSAPPPPPCPTPKFWWPVRCGGCCGLAPFSQAAPLHLLVQAAILCPIRPPPTATNTPLPHTPQHQPWSGNFEVAANSLARGGAFVHVPINPSWITTHFTRVTKGYRIHLRLRTGGGDGYVLMGDRRPLLARIGTGAAAAAVEAASAVPRATQGESLLPWASADCRRRRTLPSLASGGVLRPQKMPEPPTSEAYGSGSGS